MKAITHIALLGRLVKFSHTIFALPFALAAVALTTLYVPLQPWRVVAIIVCVISARTAAMAFNRVVDRDIDSKNKRTQNREIPAGHVSVRTAQLLVIVSSVVFLCTTATLGFLPLVLSPLALGLALGYSYAKRFTAFCHIILGLAVAFAPGGAWIATGAPLNNFAPYLLVLAVAFWVAGFDILYSLADRDFDRAAGLHSIPAKVGTQTALGYSALLHLGTCAGLWTTGFVVGAGWLYQVGAALITLVLLIEHVMLSPATLRRVNQTFFEINGVVSVIYLLFTLGDVLIRAR